MENLIILNNTSKPDFHVYKTMKTLNSEDKSKYILFLE